MRLWLRYRGYTLPDPFSLWVKYSGRPEILRGSSCWEDSQSLRTFTARKRLGARRDTSVSLSKLVAAPGRRIPSIKVDHSLESGWGQIEKKLERPKTSYLKEPGWGGSIRDSQRKQPHITRYTSLSTLSATLVYEVPRLGGDLGVVTGTKGQVNDKTNSAKVQGQLKNILVSAIGYPQVRCQKVIFSSVWWPSAWILRLQGLTWCKPITFSLCHCASFPRKRLLPHTNLSIFAIRPRPTTLTVQCTHNGTHNSRAFGRLSNKWGVTISASVPPQVSVNGSQGLGGYGDGRWLEKGGPWFCPRVTEDHGL